jgi:hypothetical protein
MDKNYSFFTLNRNLQKVDQTFNSDSRELFFELTSHNNFLNANAWVQIQTHDLRLTAYITSVLCNLMLVIRID